MNVLKVRLLALLAAAVALAACDTRSSDPPPDIIKSQRQSMDKAKDVEKTLQQSTDVRREQSEQAGKQ